MSRFAFIAALTFASSAFAETHYFAGMEDLPLAPRLAEQGGGFQFDDAGGRITGAVAEGAARPDAVRGFYVDTLPALGWGQSPTDDGQLVFQRGRERLTLVITPTHDGARLEARLFTRPAAMNAD